MLVCKPRRLPVRRCAGQRPSGEVLQPVVTTQVWHIWQRQPRKPVGRLAAWLSLRRLLLLWLLHDRAAGPLSQCAATASKCALERMQPLQLRRQAQRRAVRQPTRSAGQSGTVTGTFRTVCCLEDQVLDPSQRCVANISSSDLCSSRYKARPSSAMLGRHSRAGLVIPEGKHAQRLHRHDHGAGLSCLCRPYSGNDWPVPSRPQGHSKRAHDGDPEDGLKLSEIHNAIRTFGC